MIKQLTEKYIQLFDARDLEGVGELLNVDFILEDPIVKRVEGKQAALEAIYNIFNNSDTLSFKSRNIYIQDNTSLIEFELKLDDNSLYGVDIIEWKNETIIEMRAYLDTPK